MVRAYIWLCLLCLGCGSPDGTAKRVVVQGGTYEEKIAFPFNDPRAYDRNDVDYARDKVEALIDLRRSQMNSDLFDITYYYVIPYGFANRRVGKRIGPDAFVGQWIKYYDDFTYRYGVFDKVIGSGIYHYSDQDLFLFMVDDDHEIEPRIFNVNSNSEFFSFIGRPIMIINDGGGDQLLLANWANDRFLKTVTIIDNISNGMQIMMKKAETQPVPIETE